MTLPMSFKVRVNQSSPDASYPGQISVIQITFAEFINSKNQPKPEIQCTTKCTFGQKDNLQSIVCCTFDCSSRLFVLTVKSTNSAKSQILRSTPFFIFAFYEMTL